MNVLDTQHNQQSSQEVGSVEQAREVADRIDDHGQRAHIVECDVTKDDQVRAMIEETVSEFGGLDVLVNNAGVITVAEVEEMDDAHLSEVVDRASRLQEDVATRP